MINTRKDDRRRGDAVRSWRRQPLFMQVPKPFAASILAACALLTLLVTSIASPALAFGSIFLLICAFGAWFVGTNYGLILGLFLLVITYLEGHLIGPGGADVGVLLSLAFELCSSLIVVLMLGVARAALELEWKYARTDPLTGALNRKAFFEALEKDSSRSAFSMLIFADVDGLKTLNDTFGHEKGDQALQSFSAKVKSSIRKNDLFARLGGDEFVIFLKVRDAAAAGAVAERLDLALNSQHKESMALKCSLGALLLPHGSQSIDAELQLADTLMYEAKRKKAGLVISDSTSAVVEGQRPKVSSEKSAKHARRLPGLPSRYSATVRHAFSTSTQIAP